VDKAARLAQHARPGSSGDALTGPRRAPNHGRDLPTGLRGGRMSRKWAVPAVLLTLCALFSTNAIAGGQPRTHDGFFLRLSAGAGGANTSFDNPSMELDGTGSADLNFAIGGAIKPNLILHGTMWGWLISDPDASGGLGSGTLDGDVDMTAFGGGITYYFMPVNIYLSGSAGFGTMSFDGPFADGETDNGFVGDLTLGKEWWVGGSWGLGFAGGLSYSSLPDGGLDGSWTGTSWAIRFSATLN
jgi:hypothetical protein